MKNTNGFVMSATLIAVLLGGIGSAWAEENTEQPPAEEKPAAPTAMTTPALTGPLVANPNPMNFDLGPLGPVYLTGVVTPLVLWKTLAQPHLNSN